VRILSTKKDIKGGAAEVRGYLRRNGIVEPRQVNQILTGFDFNEPIYEHQVSPGDTVYQFVRLPSADRMSPTTGNWFALRGATKAGLAITDGLAGRRLHEYRVVAAADVLEGTAKGMEMKWDWDGGGPGGATQIYIPPNLLGCVEYVSPSE
jgi:hypothetical protein